MSMLELLKAGYADLSMLATRLQLRSHATTTIKALPAHLLLKSSHCLCCPRCLLLCCCRALPSGSSSRFGSLDRLAGGLEADCHRLCLTSSLAAGTGGRRHVPCVWPFLCFRPKGPRGEQRRSLQRAHTACKLPTLAAEAVASATCCLSSASAAACALPPLPPPSSCSTFFSSICREWAGRRRHPLGPSAERIKNTSCTSCVPLQPCARPGPRLASTQQPMNPPAQRRPAG